MRPDSIEPGWWLLPIKRRRRIHYLVYIWLVDLAQTFIFGLAIIGTIWVMLTVVLWIFPISSEPTLVDVLRSQWEWLHRLRIY